MLGGNTKAENLFEIKKYLKNGKLIKLPQNKFKRNIALLYIISKFEYEIEYTESEVNEIIKLWYSSNKHEIIRIALCDEGLLCREDEGKLYYKPLK